MGVRAGIIVPHAPLLALEGRPDLDVFRRSARDATGVFDGCDLVVLLSPHGAEDGVHREVTGTLAGFGVDGIEVDEPSDPEFGAELAERWGREMIGAPVDHGVVGSLSIAPVEVPVVACSFAEITGPGAPGRAEGAVESAFLLADALVGMAEDRTVGVIASAHTAASLTRKAPLALRPEGKELDDFILDCLATDCGSLARIEPDLWHEAGACGAGPLTAFGVLFEPRRAQVLAYDHPVGVGYLVATAVHD